MSLDIAVARAVARARLLERAVHDSGPWEIEISGVRLAAVKVKSDTRVMFLCTVPAVCFVEPPEFAQLYCAGEMVGSKEIVVPLEGSFMLQWSLTADDGEPARV